MFAPPTTEQTTPKPRREQFVRVPTTYLGTRSDGVRSGKGKLRTRDASAAAILLCWKLSSEDRERYRPKTRGPTSCSTSATAASGSASSTTPFTLARATDRQGRAYPKETRPRLSVEELAAPTATTTWR